MRPRLELLKQKATTKGLEGLIWSVNKGQSLLDQYTTVAPEPEPEYVDPHFANIEDSQVFWDGDPNSASGIKGWTTPFASVKLAEVVSDLRPHQAKALAAYLTKDTPQEGEGEQTEEIPNDSNFGDPSRFRHASIGPKNFGRTPGTFTKVIPAA